MLPAHNCTVRFKRRPILHELDDFWDSLPVVAWDDDGRPLVVGNHGLTTIDRFDPIEWHLDSGASDAPYVIAAAPGTTLLVRNGESLRVDVEYDVVGYLIERNDDAPRTIGVPLILMNQPPDEMGNVRDAHECGIDNYVIVVPGESNI